MQKRSVSGMQRLIPRIAAALAAAAAVLACCAALLGEPWFTLAITAGAAAYHFVMRLAVGRAVGRLRLNSHAAWFRPRAWEAGLYRALRVDRWKGRMPTYVAGSFDWQMRGAEAVLDAMCAAEVTHEAIAVLGFATLILAALCEDGTVCLIIMTATSLASALAELMFAAMQRYNRPRLERVAERIARRAERRMAHEHDGRL